MNHQSLVQAVCDQALQLIKSSSNKLIPLKFRPMIRKNNRVNTRQGYAIGRTNLKTGLITIDIFTPKFRKPKAIASILRILAHEIAHHQKPPYRSKFRHKTIIRRHYPAFYKQVNKNILKFKKDKRLSNLFK